HHRVFLHIFRAVFTPHVLREKGVFQRIIALIMLPEKGNEIQEVRIIECPVLETQQLLKVFRLVLCHEFVRRIVHAPGKLRTFIDNCFTLSPRQHRRKKPHNLYILSARIPMRDAYRVVLNERWPVVLVNLAIQKGLERLCHGRSACSRSSSRSSLSSIPTLMRIRLSTTPTFSRTSRGMEPCVIVAG